MTHARRAPELAAMPNESQHEVTKVLKVEMSGADYRGEPRIRKGRITLA